MQDFVLSSIYESYDFESIPEIPFEWLLLFNIYPEVNWKITRQLKDHRSPAQAENSNRFFTQFIWPSGEQTSVLNPLTGHLVSSKSCDQCPVSLGRVWPVTSALVALLASHKSLNNPVLLWICKKSKWNSDDGWRPFSANTEYVLHKSEWNSLSIMRVSSLAN